MRRKMQTSRLETRRKMQLPDRALESERGDGEPAGWSPLAVGSVAAAAGVAIAWALARARA